MRLTRRDRAALTLALECVRHFPTPLYKGQQEADAEAACCEAFDHLTARPYDGDRLALTLALNGYEMRATGRRPWRLLRARLALLLRAVLRADRGDYGPGPWGCASCGSSDYSQIFNARLGHCACNECGGEEIVERTSRRITPLWSLAPETCR